MKELAISLPLFVHTTKTKTQKGKFILNLNNYRNCHFLKLNKAKTVYAEEVKRAIGDIKIKFKKVELEYTYFAKTKRRIDVSNPCSVIDKFTCDALSQLGIWKDDNSDIIKSVKYKFAGIDKNNPRCELKIKEI